MNNPINRNYLPENHRQLVSKLRKVVPPDLKVDESISNRVSRTRAALSTGLTPYSGEWNTTLAAHLLKRTLFGVRKDDLNTSLSLGMEATVDLLLQKGQRPDPPVNDYNNAGDGVEDPIVPYGESWITAPFGGDYEGQRVTSLKSWMVKNMVRQGMSLEEKMILFWHNLLPAEIWAVFIARASYQYVELLRRNVFGNYKVLIKEMTKDPAMLLYLNGAFNNKYAPDENYGRELQELFCIGKGPGSGYTEDDVKAAARVLTGFTIDWEVVNTEGIIESIFYPDYHDTSDKTFSSFYGNTVISGKSGVAGADELDEMLDMMFSAHEVSKYICRRLYNYFVYPVIDEATEAAVIEPLAQLFRDNNYELNPVLSTLFKSEHFYDLANVGAMIKSPADALVGLWRTLAVPDVDQDIYLLYRQHISMIWNMGSWGMEIGDPPSVSGWPAYYQTPQFDKAWITTDSITSRAIFSDSLVYWGFWINEDHQMPADFLIYLETLDHPEDPVAMLRESSQLLLGIQLSDELLQNLKSILLSGQSTDGYWTTAWTVYQSDKGNEEYKMTLVNRLKPTFQHLLQLSEAQLM